MSLKIPARRRGFRLAAEVTAWTVAAVCLTGWTLATVSGRVARRDAVASFAAAQALQASSAPDTTLWSPERIQAWTEARRISGPAPLAILRIRRVGLEAPVLEGTDDGTLNRAAGHIADTAAPGAEGNSGIAAHRDGFFRSLKDVRVGDLLEIETLQGVVRYRIDRTWIVEPEDVSVLDPTPGAAVTLVTCYPFYFVGPAPQRYIVRAVRTGS